jgi:hypothetical protein
MKSALILILLSLTACTTIKPDPRADLIRSLPGEAVENYRFIAHEDDERVAASLINPALRSPVRIGPEPVVLGYMKVIDKKTGVATVYKNEIARSANAISLVVRDVRSGTVVFTQSSPVAAGGICDNEQKFSDLNECVCKKKGPFQCDADRSCDTLFPAMLCCLQNGSIVSVHLIITPAFSRQCLLKGLIIDFSDLVLTQ